MIEEEIFYLCYYVPGFVYDVDKMGPTQRDRFLELTVRERKRKAKRNRW